MYLTAPAGLHTSYGNAWGVDGKHATCAGVHPYSMQKHASNKVTPKILVNHRHSWLAAVPSWPHRSR